jgi:hypothetical protein
LLAWNADLRADVAVLGASHDNTLYEDPQGALSNGAGSYFFTGVTAQGLRRRGLLSFDLSAIPPGATINSVQLTLHMSRTPATGEPITLYRVLEAWGEGASVAADQEGAGAPAQPGDATWLHTFFNTSFWQSAGGDFDPAERASTLVEGTGFYTWSSHEMLDDVRAWFANPGSNHGWVLVGDESPGVATTTKRFDSRENSDPTVRPVLAVDYTPVPGPGGLVLAAGIGCWAACRRRRMRVH